MTPSVLVNWRKGDETDDPYRNRQGAGLKASNYGGTLGTEGELPRHFSFSRWQTFVTDVIISAANHWPIHYFLCQV